MGDGVMLTLLVFARSLSFSLSLALSSSLFALDFFDFLVITESLEVRREKMRDDKEKTLQDKFQN